MMHIPPPDPTDVSVPHNIDTRRPAAAPPDFESLLGSINGIVWEADPNTLCFTYVSPKAEQMLGYPLEQWYAGPDFWPDHIHPDDREKTVSHCAAATAQGHGHEMVYRMIAADGRVVWMHDVVTVVLDDNGQAARIRGVLIDITSQKRKEQQAAALQEAILRAMPAHIMVLDTAGHVAAVHVYADPPRCRGQFPGFDLPVGASYEQMCHTAIEQGCMHASTVLAGINDIRAGRRSQFDYEYGIARHGKENYFRMIVTPMADDAIDHVTGIDADVLHDAAGGVLITHFSITKRMRAEQKLRRRVAAESLVVSVSNDLAAATGDELDRAIHRGLEAIGRFTGADRCHLVRIGRPDELPEPALDADGTRRPPADEVPGPAADGSDDGQIIRNTHEWCADGIAQHMHNLQHVPLAAIPWWAEQLEHRRNIHVPDVADMPPEAAVEQHLFQFLGMKSAVAVPLVFESKVVGFIGLNAVRDHHTWVDEELKLLGSIGQHIMTVLERRRAVTRLAEREAQYRTLTECTRDMISLQDMDGRIIYVNPVSESYIGIDPADLVGRSIFDFIHPDDHQRMQAAHERNRVGQPSFISWRLLSEGASPLWVESNSSVIMDDADRPYAVVCTTRDVTARVRAESALRESEQRFAKIFNASTVGILITNLDDGRVIDVNDRMLRIMERDRSEVIDRTTVDLQIWSRPEERESMIRTIRANHSVSNVDNEIRTPDGRLKHTLSSLEVVQLDGRDCIIGIINDVTDRRRTELALRESEQRFQAFMEMNPAAAWIKDADGRYVFVNRTLKDVYRIRSEDVLGRTDIDLLGPDVGAALQRNDQRVMHTGRAIEVVEEIPNPDGRVHSWMIYKFPLPAADAETASSPDAPVHLVGGIAVDITERLEHEHHLRRYARMQQAVAELGLLVARSAGQYTGVTGHAVKQMAEAEVDQLVSTAAERLASTLNVPFAAVFEQTPDGSALHRRAGVGWDDRAADRATIPIDSGSAITRALTSREPLTIDRRDDQSDSLLDAHHIDVGIITVIHGRTVGDDNRMAPFGVLGVFNDGPRTFTVDEISFVQSVSNILTAGIDRCRAVAERHLIIRDLHERIKELSLLHQTWRLFQDRTLSVPALMQRIVRMMTGAWMHVDSAAARITIGDDAYVTDNWRATKWMQQATVHTTDGRAICVELAYLDDHPEEYEGPFIAEERALIDTLAESIRTHLESRHAEESLRRSERQFKALVEHTPDAIVRFDRNYRHEYVSPSVRQLVGLDPHAVVGRTIDEVGLSPDVARQVKRGLRRAFETRREAVIEIELPAPSAVTGTASHAALSTAGDDDSDHEPRRSGENVFLEARLVPEFGDDGAVESVLSIARDVTDRKKAEVDLRRSGELQRLMLSELDHRVRNNLAALAALIDITARERMDVPSFASSIKGRVQAMATVHSLLSRGHWRAIGLRALVAAIVPDDLVPRVEITGDEVQMAPQQVTAMGMVFQELIANSLKYGALKAEGGSVDLAWDVRDRPDEPGVTLHLHWRERGGPHIATKPRPGLGTGLIRGFVRAELRGEAEFTYPRDGAQHSFVMCLEPVES